MAKQPQPDTGPDGLLLPHRLAAIEKVCREARNGYAATDCHAYARDVGALLEERRLLLEQVAGLKATVEAVATGSLPDNRAWPIGAGALKSDVLPAEKGATP